MYMKNLTPHDIVFYLSEFGGKVILHPEPEGLRLEEVDVRVSKEWVTGPGGLFPGAAGLTEVQDWEPTGNVQLALPLVKKEYRVPANLPKPEPGVLLVVSLPALIGLRAAGVDRRDIVSFDTGPGPFGAIRDEAGRVVGCRRLISIGDFPEGIYGGGGWTVEEWEAANRANTDLPGEYVGDDEQRVRR